MQTIIFRMTLRKKYGGFALISNFISKMQDQKKLVAEEVRGIHSYLSKKHLSDDRSVMSETKRYNNNFLEISKPENLIEGSKGFQLAYCICIDENEIDDIVELQYCVLIKKFFKKLILGTILTGSEDFYFKASHYLCEISQTNQFIYNSIYFDRGNQPIRLQVSNIERLKDFVPLILVNNDSLKMLRKPLNHFASNEVLVKCLNGELSVKKLDCPPYLKGCIELLQKVANVLNSLDSEMLQKLLFQSNLITFLLFSYSFPGCIKGLNRKKITTLYVRHFYQQTEECAAGCLQLVENIVLHAASATGVLSIRFHSRKSQYLVSRYEGNISDVPHLEILITDYCGTSENKNIADNFVANILQKELRDCFADLKPLDFIENKLLDEEHKKIIKNAFQKYYSYSDNIGRHYGLKIFQKMLKKNQGIFSFYSHSTSKNMEGETYNLQENTDRNTHAQCIPGTSFSVLFPLKNREIETNNFTSGIDQNYVLQDKMGYYLQNYVGIDYQPVFPEIEWNTQDEKEKRIKEIGKEIWEKIWKERENQNEKKKIIYITAKDFSVGYAEYICKALLLNAYKGKMPDFVFYNCTEEFAELFLQTMKVYFEMGTMNYALDANDFAIVLYTANPIKELILIPQSRKKTFIVNRVSGYSENEIFAADWLFESDFQPDDIDETEVLNIPPYDILHEVNIDGAGQTIFEAYVQQVLETDIQEKFLGCKISDTHMRLGSTIHIDSFYEAELLFNNKLFSTRFAYLLVKWIIKSREFEAGNKFTLYSYALYSELFIFKALNILEELYPTKSFDYAILEREAEHRGFNHVDRIRYSTFFDSGSKEEVDEKRKKHFAERKIICVVPINSTLKTHEKLIDLFCKENNIVASDNVIMNFAVILVGSKETNVYWNIDEVNRTFLDINLQISPIPHYFVAVKVKYQEASECELCFPDNPLLEKPLIEVNAASTIPNQSFGLYMENTEKDSVSWEWIENEENKIKVLKNSLIYSHVKRGENHFSFYFQTDRLFIENKEAIEKWMEGIALNINVNLREHHILVCPSHFSNAGFLEYVNKIIFRESAQIFRIDVDKEYRCNMEAKYSYLYEYLKKLADGNEEAIVQIYYIDDCIITGRTFYRAKSLIESVLGIYINEYSNIRISLFKYIFVLLDRNSSKTKMQYLESDNENKCFIDNQNGRFYAFRTLHISSVRNHGDSCIICQLAKQDKILYRTSVTKFMSEHWKDERKRYRVRLLSDKKQEMEINEESKCINEPNSQNEKIDRSYRRMFCMHTAGVWLNEKYHGNRTENALYSILKLLLSDYNGRKINSQSEAFEYLVSYLKVISRPFVAFSKSVREAIFDIILIFLEFLLCPKQAVFTKKLLNAKPYLKENKNLLYKANREIICDLTDPNQRRDLLLVLMKQGMELRSNYFIRPENVRKLSAFVKAEKYSAEQEKEVYYKYLYYVKKLMGVNSDTSKSAWFASRLCDQYARKDLLGLPDDIFMILYIENVRAYYDGILRLSKEEKSNVEFWNEEMRKYHYRDFTLTIRDYKWLDKNDILTPIGGNSLSAAILLFQTGENFRKKNLEKGERKDIRSSCQRIVGFMEAIAQADNVKLVLELPMECDLWEDKVKKGFNELLYEDLRHQQFELEDKKEYIVIADSSEDQDAANSLTRKQMDVIKKFHQRQEASEYSFYIDKEDKYFVWEIGQNNQQSLIFYLEFGYDDDYKMMYAIKSILVMNYYFNKYIFNRKTRANLYELMLSEKERLLYNINKIESHTSSDIKNRQYMDVLKNEKALYYKSYVLTLLKDLKVSDTYRPSLHESYYCRNLKIGTFPWTGTAIEFDKKHTRFYVVGTRLYKYISLYVNTEQTWLEDEYPLKESDKLIAFKLSNSESTPFLLIMALVMNAADEERADMTSTGVDPETAEVNVYLTRTRQGDLRILNFSRNESKDVEQIKAEMERPPRRDEGISLWSMSRYIKSIVSTLADKCLQKYRTLLQGQNLQDEKRETLLELRSLIADLLSEKYQIKINCGEIDGKKFFSVDIPILAEKYDNYKQFF